MRTRRRLGILVAVLFGLGTFLAAQAGADVVDATPREGANQLQISRIDAKNPEAVETRFTWNGDIAALRSMTLRQNGSEVEGSNPAPLGDEDVSRATVFVIDQTASMTTSGALKNTVDVIRQMIADAPDNARFGIVTFGSTSRVAESMTGDAEALDKALDGIKPEETDMSSLWDGVVQGVQLLDRLPDYEHNLIVVTDGPDKGSSASAGAAVSAVIGGGPDTGATVYAIGIDADGKLDRAGLSQLVEKAGGRFFVVSEAKEVGDAFDKARTAIDNEFVTTFAALPESRGKNTLEMTISNVSTSADFTVGGVAEGATTLETSNISKSSAPSFFSTAGGLLLGLVLIALAIGVAAYLAIQMVTTRQSALDAALNPYTEGYVAREGEDDASGGLSENALLQRALAMTEQFAERQGFLESLEVKLDMAEIPLKASEAMLVWAGAAVLLTVIGFFIGGFVVAFVLLVATILAAPAVLNFKAARRQRKFEQQLPDMLTLLAGALRAGFSLMQAVDAVSQEMQNPMGGELRRVVSESRLGRDLEDALDDTAERTGSADFAWAVMAIRIQREVGGNLAELLLTVADTMIQRERLRREVKALTAEGRISAYVLTILPPGLGFVMYLSNPDYMNPLFHDTLGLVLLGLSLIGMVVGFFWMQKVVQIDV